MKLKICLCIFLQNQLGIERCLELGRELQREHERSRKRLVRLKESDVYGVVDRDILYIRQAFLLNEE